MQQFERFISVLDSVCVSWVEWEGRIDGNHSPTEQPASPTSGGAGQSVSVSGLWSLENDKFSPSPESMKLLRGDEGVMSAWTQVLCLPPSWGPAAFLLRSLLLVLEQHRVEFVLGDVQTAYRVASDWSTPQFVAFAKYVHTWPLSVLEETPLAPRAKPPAGWPVREDGRPVEPWLFSGPTRAHLKRVLLRDSPRTHKVFLDWYSSRRSDATVPKSFQLKALEDHRVALTSPEAPPESPANERVAEFFIGDLCERIAGRARARFGESVEMPTTASFATPRVEGGKRADTLALGGTPLPACGPMLEVENLLNIGDGPLVRLEPHLPLPGERLIVDRALDLAETAADAYHVRIVPIIEPLKVRVISAGSGAVSAVLRPMQRALFEQLSRSPLLQHTAKPDVQPTDVRLLAQRASVFWEAYGVSTSKWWWISGDYKAATDGLRQFATRAAWKHLSDVLRRNAAEADKERTARATRVGMKSLTQAFLQYIKDGELFAQMTGQLMGNELSFSILCLINAAAFLLAVLEYLLGPDFPARLRECDAIIERFCRLGPASINGDDFLSLSDDRLYGLWVKWTRVMGFVPSVGKNFFHPHVLCINSQFFHIHKYVDGPQPSDSWWDGEICIQALRPLNTALLLGMVDAERAWVKDLSLTARYNKLQRTAENHRALHARFVRYNKESIARLTGDGLDNLFGDVVLGGCGFDYYDDIDVDVTRVQLAYAHQRLLRHSGDGRPFKAAVRTKELPGEGSRALGSRTVLPAKEDVSVFRSRKGNRLDTTADVVFGPSPRPSDGDDGVRCLFLPRDQPALPGEYAARPDLDVTPRNAELALSGHQTKQALLRKRSLPKAQDWILMDRDFFLRARFRVAFVNAPPAEQLQVARVAFPPDQLEGPPLEV